MNRLRWKLWGLATRSRRVCPTNAYLAIVGTERLTGRDRQTIRPDDECRRDCALNGICFCGMLRTEAGEAVRIGHVA